MRVRPSTISIKNQKKKKVQHVFMVSCLLDANPLIIPAKGTSTPDIKWDNHTRHMKQRAMLKKCLLGQKDH